MGQIVIAVENVDVWTAAVKGNSSDICRPVKLPPKNCWYLLFYYESLKTKFCRKS